MFQMMNAARINTGVSGMTLASTAYHNALEYTKNRQQGRDITGRDSGQVPLISHPDVRRMLLWMKAAVDGMRSLIYTGAFWQDLSLELPDGDEKDHYRHLLDFMTPIIKAYCSDLGFKVCETAIQCLGGYGYCRDYPLEQYLRDAKIMSLYEGTNGIQSMDLLGRKLRISGGAPLHAFLSEIKSFLDANSDHYRVGENVRTLDRVVQKIEQVAAEMKVRMKTDPLLWAANTYPALVAFSEAAAVWRLLDMAIVAQAAIDSGKKSDFYSGKVMQAVYFSDITLPHTLATLEATLSTGSEVVDMPLRAF